MFEKEADKYAKPFYNMTRYDYVEERTHVKRAFKDGAEFGYNKANEWHYVKDGDLPKEDKDGNILVYHTSYGGHCEVGYFNVKDKSFMDSDIIAWCEIPKYMEE